jgi:hypothetical protein
MFVSGYLRKLWHRHMKVLSQILVAFPDMEGRRRLANILRDWFSALFAPQL